jgi:GNAT superfamily N-acetyltransferase
VSDAISTAGSAAPASTPGWHVRAACHGDVREIAAAVAALLDELVGTPDGFTTPNGSTTPDDPTTPDRSVSPTLATQRDLPAMEGSARALIDDPQAGALLVGEAAGAIVGVLAASRQSAIHVPGPYLLIQDLWVHPSWRGRTVGNQLVATLFEIARDSGIDRVEVGLPQASFRHFGATEAFYVANGFAANGPRMRRTL